MFSLCLEIQRWSCKTSAVQGSWAPICHPFFSIPSGHRFVKGNVPIVSGAVHHS